MGVKMLINAEYLMHALQPYCLLLKSIVLILVIGIVHTIQIHLPIEHLFYFPENLKERNRRMPHTIY